MIMCRRVGLQAMHVYKGKVLGNRVRRMHETCRTCRTSNTSTPNFLTRYPRLFFLRIPTLVLFCHTLTHLNVGRAAPPQPLTRARLPARRGEASAEARGGSTKHYLPYFTLSESGHSLSAALRWPSGGSRCAVNCLRTARAPRPAGGTCRQHGRAKFLPSQGRWSVGRRHAQRACWRSLPPCHRLATALPNLI